MKTNAVSLACCLALAGASPSFATSYQPADSPEKRAAMARAYVAEFPAADLVEGVVRHAAGSLSAIDRERFVEENRKRIRTDAIEQARLEALKTNFTADEIEALTARARSPVYRKAESAFLGEIVGAFLREMREKDAARRPSP